MNKMILITFAAVVTACTSASPTQFYRPINETEQWVISGRFNQLSYEHQVLVNDSMVVMGKLPYDHSDTSLNGSYRDKTVSSDCHWKSKTDLRCLVKVDGEAAATLAF